MHLKSLGLEADTILKILFIQHAEGQEFTSVYITASTLEIIVSDKKK